MSKQRRVSVKQLKMLLELLEEHPDLIMGLSRSGLLGVQTVRERSWQSIARCLNAIPGGVSKTAYQWRRYWNAFKGKIKNKVRDDSRRSAPLDDIDQKVLEMIRPLLGPQEVHVPSDTLQENENCSSVPSSEIKVEIVETDAQNGDIAAASPPHADTPDSSPSSNLYDTPELMNQEHVPRWMYDLEIRRVEAEERLAGAMERLADIVDRRLEALERTVLRLCPDQKNNWDCV